VKSIHHYRGLINLITLLTGIDVLVFIVMSGIVLVGPSFDYQMSLPVAVVLSIIIIITTRLVLVIYLRRKTQRVNSMLSLPFK